MKFRIRKLIFLVVLAALASAPFLVAEHKSRTTTDPYILMAREVQGFRLRVNVLGIENHPNFEGVVTVFVYVRDFPDWTIRQDHPNFQTKVLQAAARQDFEGALILIGWDFPPPDYRVQALWMCEELRRQSCAWEAVPSITVPADKLPWPEARRP